MKRPRISIKDEAELRKMFNDFTDEEVKQFVEFRQKALNHITTLQIQGGLHAH